ncbi:MAG: hypothetical protein II187_02365, partial [Treponema sp.]|nr:hypothetical protein [Treponema sp.]
MQFGKEPQKLAGGHFSQVFVQFEKKSQNPRTRPPAPLTGGAGQPHAWMAAAACKNLCTRTFYTQKFAESDTESFF